MSVRKEQKETRKQIMLDAATALFVEQGFQKTTMDMIAARANFGVATLYKYFQSKEGLYRELIMPDLEKIFEQGERIIQRPPKDPADAAVALVKSYMNFLNGWQDKLLLRTVSLPTSGDDSGVLASVSDWADVKVIEQFRDLLRVLQNRGSVPQEASVSDMATVLFNVFNQEYLTYVMHDNIPASHVFATIERLVRTLFQPWRVSASKVLKETPSDARVTRRRP